FSNTISVSTRWLRRRLDRRQRATRGFLYQPATARLSLSGQRQHESRSVGGGGNQLGLLGRSPVLSNFLVLWGGGRPVPIIDLGSLADPADGRPTQFCDLAAGTRP